MPTHIAMLRAVNVGGTGKLPMADLRALCEALGFRDVRTYLQSGNVVFNAPLAPAAAKASLERALAKRLGKPCRVLVRSAQQLKTLLAKQPFPKAEPNRVLVLFLDEAPPKGALTGWKIPADEELHLAGKELVIHFPDGMGKSKLKVPFADIGTGRNLNTIRALVELATSAR
jgi:uncharacterized protein (DUF1697 family)